MVNGKYLSEELKVKHSYCDYLVDYLNSQNLQK